MNSFLPANDITIGWIDPGTVDSRFAQGLADVCLESPYIKKFIRISNNHIPEQRYHLLRLWYEMNQTEWLLCVDSDIFITPQNVEMLLQSAHPIHKPVISGLYFIYEFLKAEVSVPNCIPCIYKKIDGVNTSIKDFEKNSLIEIDAAGFGCVLIHRNAVTLLLEKYESNNFFRSVGNENFASAEDFAFFAHLKECGIQAYANTGVSVQHIKRFVLDENYFDMVNNK